jgi:surfeit locus 1 family protein
MKGRILFPALLTLCGLAVLLGLGTWQLERKAWKDSLIATLSERLDSTPQALPPRQTWQRLEPASTEFLRVAFRATFPAGLAPRNQHARLYTSGSALRDDIKAPGYFVFAPARLADGGIVVVNRGYVPAPAGGAQTLPAPLPEGTIELVGVLRWPETARWFVSSYSPTDDMWFVRDHVAMAAHSGWGTVAPFYVEQELPRAGSGAPRPGRLSANLPNNHLQYALTWYGLALALATIFAIWFMRRRRSSDGAASG